MSKQSIAKQPATKNSKVKLYHSIDTLWNFMSTGCALIADSGRIKFYPALGFQIEMPFPDDIDHAYQALKKLGFK